MDHPRVITSMATTNRMNMICGHYENEQLTLNRPNSYGQMNNNSDNINANSINQNNRVLPFINNVKIVGLNVCGLRTKLLKDKSFENFAIKYEILCLSETKTDHIDLSGTILNGEYSCFVKEKSVNSHRYGGVHGLAMIIKDNIAAHAQLLADVESPYVLWVKFSKKAFGFECILGSAYLPGEESKYKDKEMFEVISNDIFRLKNTHNLPICLLGDLNSRTGELDDCFKGGVSSKITFLGVGLKSLNIS